MTQFLWDSFIREIVFILPKILAKITSEVRLTSESSRQNYVRIIRYTLQPDHYTHAYISPKIHTHQNYVRIIWYALRPNHNTHTHTSHPKSTHISRKKSKPKLPPPYIQIITHTHPESTRTSRQKSKPKLHLNHSEVRLTSEYNTHTHISPKIHTHTSRYPKLHPKSFGTPYICLIRRIKD